MELRREIHEGLNVIESWNGANDFILYGRGGEITSNRLEDQESNHAGSALAAELHGLRQHADGPARARRDDLAETHGRHRAAGADPALLGPCEPIRHLPARHDRTLAPRSAHPGRRSGSIPAPRRLMFRTQPLLCTW